MMFTSDEIALLVATMKRNGVAELDIRHDAEELRLVSAAGARPGPSSSLARLPGRFLQRPSAFWIWRQPAPLPWAPPSRRATSSRRWP